MKRRAIALLRVSTEGQAGPDRQGLPAQREACQRIAAAHGLEIVDTLELEGVSGAAVLSDEQFTGMLRRLRAGEVQAVIVAAFNRLFRRKQFADYAILDAFRESGARLYSGDGELDLSGESGGLLALLRGELAGIERRRIIERTTAARRRLRRERGIRAENPNVGMPRGVAFDSDTGTWRYVFPEAEAIRDVFRLFLGGERNLAEIHRRTGVGAPTEPSSAGAAARLPRGDRGGDARRKAQTRAARGADSSRGVATRSVDLEQRALIVG